jgi:hypothetical protein
MASKSQIDEFYRRFNSETDLTDEKILQYGREAESLGLAPNGIDSKGRLYQSKSIDPELINIIKWVNKHGMVTDASCQGHDIYELFGGSGGYISYKYPLKFRLLGLDKSSDVCKIENCIIDALASEVASNAREYAKVANDIYEMKSQRKGAIIHLPWSIDGTDSRARRKSLWTKVYSNLLKLEL